VGQCTFGLLNSVNLTVLFVVFFFFLFPKVVRTYHFDLELAIIILQQQTPTLDIESLEKWLLEWFQDYACSTIYLGSF